MLVNWQNELRDRARRLRGTDDGAALVAVIMIMVFTFVVVGIVATASLFMIRQTSGSTERLRAFSAAEAGRDAAVAQLLTGCGLPGDVNIAVTAGSSTTFDWTIYPSSGATAPISSSGLSSGCPSSSTNYVVIRAVGHTTLGATKTIESVYPWSVATASIRGAVTSHSGLVLNNSQIIQNEGGDVTIATGNFSCNGSGNVFEGSVYVLNGTANVTNSCQVGGNLYASDSVSMDSGATVHGDVYTGGNLSIANPTARIYGSATVAGTVNISGGGTIGGQLLIAGTGSSYIYNANVGGISTAGYFSSLQSTTISGSFRSSSLTQSTIHAGVTVAGNLTFAGPTSTPQQPAVAGVAVYNQAGMLAPVATLPAELAPADWIDYGYSSAAWVSAGYAIRTPTACGWSEFNSAATLKNEIQALSVPTVYDLRSCGIGSNLYNITFNIKTDIAFILPQGTVSLNQAKVNSADGADHHFYVIVPDDTADSVATCGSGSIDMSNFQMDEHITGLAYSPCTIALGSNVWRGQIYAQTVTTWGTAYAYYHAVEVPGVTTPGGGGGASAGPGTMLSQRELN